MNPDTTTEAGRTRRMEQLVENYKKTGNDIGIQRLIGGAVGDQRDHINGFDDGEEPITWGVDPSFSHDPEAIY